MSTTMLQVPISKTIKNNKNLEIRYKERVELFFNNPKNPVLKTHELKGRLIGTKSFL